MSRWWRYGAASGVGALAGLAVGFIVGGSASSDWVEAAGTWVGGLGTIAAVLASVRALIVQQNNRDADADRRTSEQADLERQRTARADADRLARASLITFNVKGGRGYGIGSNFTLEELHVRLHNAASDATASAVRVLVGDVFEWTPDGGMLGPGEKVHDEVVVGKRLPLAQQSEASDRAQLTSYDCRLRFTLEGHEFERDAHGKVTERART